ncbi:MAG: hypothetical protein Q8P10_02355 [bacterium]|nr:hypothetical protein [bacterium]
MDDKISKNSSTCVTIEYARMKLGERGKNMTDKDIEKLLSLLRLVSNKAIDGVIEQKTL